MGGCCSSSPYSKRIHARDPADYDEEYAPLRYFGTNRVGSNLVPDDIVGLPSTHMSEHLISDTNVVLYEAEIDHGKGYRRLRPGYICFLNPLCLILFLKNCVTFLCCDEVCCWVKKEYSTRTYFRIYSNRIEYNEPIIRFPWACCGCGSWNGDHIIVNPFDRGAFGFTAVRCGILSFLSCCWPVYGGAVARHRCQCNGPVWNRMFTDCGGWWCDEWFCQMFFCTYRYNGLADAEEVAFAASIALQAYFEGRKIGPGEMKKCIDFYNGNISERTDPIRRKRPVCCEPYMVPLCTCDRYYRCTHPKRVHENKGKDQISDRLREVYERYDIERLEQMDAYSNFHGPVRVSTVCRAFGCRRFYGRKGFCFCTEGCDTCWSDCCTRQAGDPAPPFTIDHDFDDEWDASSVLLTVIGPPPTNVVIRRWRYDPETNANYLDIYPPPS